MNTSQDSFLQKAQSWSNILGMLPGVQAIFLSGSVAQGRANKESDIDLFFIAKHGQLWTARFFVFLILILTNQMRRDKKHAGRLCPNHFISDRYLQIEEKDAYSAHLFAHNVPLFDPHNLFSRFRSANQSWIERFGENFAPIPSPQEITHTMTLRMRQAEKAALRDGNLEEAFAAHQEMNPQDKKWGENYVRKNQAMRQRAMTPVSGWWVSLESFLERWQRFFMSFNRNLKRPGAKIILNERELRFHPEPKNKLQADESTSPQAGITPHPRALSRHSFSEG